jgi:anti-sigma regulatory factor (Ser/Thr protein kinase)
MSPEVPIRDRFDTLEAQRQTKAFALGLGFPRRACHELAVVVSELSSNILKYGKRGRVVLGALADSVGKGIAIRAYDSGPPFRRLDQAVLDGCDDTGPIDPDALLRRGGLGAGLGAVIRLTHSFEVEHEPGGKWVVAKRYLGRPLVGEPRSRV